MEDIGLLVLGHGSTLPYNKALVEELAGMIKRRHPGPVRTAYLNANDPKIPEGLMSFAGTNVRRIVAIPLFLAAGVHTLEDIPRELGIPKGERVGFVKIDGRDVEVTCAEPLGVDECIADLAYRRARESF
ncbi:MAG: sirohydrochlorin nickelochelatase [Methanothrix sp.]|uniref:sirohydrochlorin nickelochelatase n=1 Tax=Methanothrix sp. TaxID=90426 RepID=UPI0032AF4C2C|nr:sirohydrochlorin nickelochelatase [Methanothrix sp.]